MRDNCDNIVQTLISLKQEMQAILIIQNWIDDLLGAFSVAVCQSAINDGTWKPLSVWLFAVCQAIKIHIAMF